MNVNKKISFHNVIILVMLLLISKWAIMAMGYINHSNSFDLNSVIVNINEFDDFSEGGLDPLITAEKTSTDLTFSYEGGSSSTLVGWYYLSLDDYGNCTDFEFKISLDLNYNDTIMFGKIKIILGGYYNSDNQHISSNIIPETNPDKSLVMVGIEDLIDDGLYMIIEDFPDDQTGGGMSWYTDSDRDIRFIFEIARTGEQMEYEYWIDYVGGGGGMWERNMHKILNYIIFVVEIHGDVASTVSAKFFNLITELNCSHAHTLTPISNQTGTANVNYLIIISSSALLMALITSRKTYGNKKRRLN